MQLAEITKDVIAKLELYGFSPREFLRAFQFALRAPCCLSPRQKQVLIGIASGKEHRQIAEELGISHKTSIAHCYVLYRKLGIHNAAAATQYAVAHKLIELKPVVDIENLDDFGAEDAAPLDAVEDFDAEATLRESENKP